MLPVRALALLVPFALVFTSATTRVPAPRQPPEPNPFAMHRVDIAPGVYEFGETDLNAIVSSNIVAIVGTRDVLVFDSGHHPLDTRTVVESLKTLTDKPVRYLVVSHWHDDHWVGNAEFARAWPGIQVIAHPFTARMMETRREAFRGVDREVADSLTLDLGGRQVQLRVLGRGNTAGDLVAILPAEKIVLAGDLLVSPFPFATQSYISEWSRVLRAVERLKPRVIVPGHGAVEHDVRYLRDVAETLESIERQGRAAYRPGMTVDSLRARIDLSPFAERFTHGDAFLKANFDYMLQSLAVERMWEELSGQLKPEGI